MVIKLIKTDEENEAALERLSALMGAEPNTPEADELKLLATLIAAYEKERYPLSPPDPIEAIKFRMDQAGLKKKDLIPYIGDLEKVNEVLKGKRALTLKMIRALHKGLEIPLEFLLAEPSGNRPVAALHGRRQARTA